MMYVRGDIIYTPNKDKIEIFEDSYLMLNEGVVEGIVKEVPKGEGNQIIDRKGHLILPPFVDIHLHAPQYANCGLGTDVELMEWLEKYTFPEEVKYKDLKYAEALFKALINDLWTNGTLRSVIFGCLYTDATDLLFQMMAKSGLGAYIGKVNMDNNCPDFYRQTVEESISGTESLIKKYEKEDLVKPIITPRFAPHCTRESLEAQGQLAKKYGVPIQSHINESVGEIEYVKGLFPEADSYGDIYDRYGLFGSETKTIMAHCIHNTPEEFELFKKRNVFPAHCPESNVNLTSGIMPVKKFLEEGIPVGLGSDISGGNHLYIGSQMVLAIQLSKMRARLLDDLTDVLNFSEAYYMATKSGGSFFGKVGSFEKGYEGDFLVVETDSLLAPLEERSVEEKLQKFLYTGSSANIKERYVRGKKIEKPF